MSDLVQQLRDAAASYVEHLGGTWKAQDRLEWKAADEIERLSAENNGFRAALKEIGFGEDNGMANGGIMCRTIARGALDDFSIKAKT